jgi:hypothetical protein
MSTKWNEHGLVFSIIGKGPTHFGSSDSRMSPDPSRGMGKLIGGDHDINDEGSEQRRFKPVQSLHHGSVGYQSVHS